MITSRVPLVLLPFLTLTLWACSQRPQFIAREEPWRADEERACLSAGVVRESPFVELRANLGGPAVCGAIKPFSVSAAANGWVELRPPALLRCPMVPAVDHWVERVVLPAAQRHFRRPLVALKVAAILLLPTHEQRVDGARLSEHGHANAIDISGFVLADGRTVQVKTGWWGAFAERTFLRAGASRQPASLHHRARSRLRRQPPRPLPSRPGPPRPRRAKAASASSHVARGLPATRRQSCPLDRSSCKP